jgi:uncharacterized membrane protein
MPFCKNCGSPVDGQFCSKCGTQMAPAGAASAPPPPPAQPYVQASAPAAQPAPAVGVGLTDNVAGLLCYVLGFITGVLFLVLEPYNRNKFIRFHAFQSIFFNIAIIAVMIGLSIVGVALNSIPMMWAMMGLLHLVVSLGGLAVWILLLIKAYQGQRFKLPIIGDMAEKQAGA